MGANIRRMENIENLLQLGDEKDDMLLKDFVAKRQNLLNELMRGLSQQCVRSCQPYGEPVGETDEDVRVPDITPLEEQCLAKCEAKVMTLHRAIERHVDDSFNPAFAARFI